MRRSRTNRTSVRHVGIRKSGTSRGYQPPAIVHHPFGTSMCGRCASQSRRCCPSPRTRDGRGNQAVQGSPVQGVPCRLERNACLRCLPRPDPVLSLNVISTPATCISAWVSTPPTTSDTIDMAAPFSRFRQKGWHTPPGRRNGIQPSCGNSSTGVSPPDRGVQHHPHHPSLIRPGILGGSGLSRV